MSIFSTYIFGKILGLWGNDSSSYNSTKKAQSHRALEDSSEEVESGEEYLEHYCGTCRNSFRAAAQNSSGLYTCPRCGSVICS